MGGSAAVLHELTLQENALGGLSVTQHSVARVEDCTVRRNPGVGISVWNNSTVLFDSSTTVSSENGSGLVVSGSSDVGGASTHRLVVNDNWNAGVVLQIGSTYQGGTIEAHGNGFGLMMFGGSFYGIVDIRDNVYGIWVSEAAILSVRGDSSISSNVVGVLADTASRVFLTGEVTNNPGLGMRLDGVVAQLVNTEITDYVDLTFGTRVAFDGVNNLTGGVGCDDTVLVRGDVTCPAPAPSALSPGSDSSRPALPEWPERLLEHE